MSDVCMEGKGNEVMKSKNPALWSMIAVLLVSGVMMGLLVWKIDMPRTKVEAKFFDVRTSTNAVVKVEIGSADINNVGIKDALEILRNEQTNWLAVIGFFGVIFGLVVPVGSYLLQRQSLKDEREQIREELKDHRVRISRKIGKMTYKTRLDLVQIKKEADEHMNDILEDQKKLMSNQITSVVLSIESSINLCKDDNWKYEWTRRHEITSELIFILALLRRVDDREYVKGLFKRLAEILREFKGAVEANEEWRVKEGTQTSDVRFKEIQWCEDECKTDFDVIQRVLHVFGIHVLDRR